MKGRIQSVLILSSVLLFSCSEEDGAPENLNVVRYGGEVTFTANEWTDTYERNTILVSGGQLQLSVYLNENVKSLSIDVVEGIAETSYEVKKNVVSAVYYMNDNKGHYTYWEETPHGEVVITEIDELNQTMSGTFSALLERETGEMEISNGTFTDVPYMVEEWDLGTETIAKLDGVAFKAEPRGASGAGVLVSFSYAHDRQYLEFAFPADELGVGTFDVADFNLNYYTGIRYVDGLYTYRANAGTITITEYTANQHIKGTFAFDVESHPIDGTIKSFTEGSFDVTF